MQKVPTGNPSTGWVLCAPPTFATAGEQEHGSGRCGGAHGRPRTRRRAS
jgi:hypothetical protein